MENSKIKNIVITMENCESYYIPVENIRMFSVDGFTEKLTIHYYHNNNISKSKRAYKVHLIIKNPENIKSFYDFSKPFQERVKSVNDICYINIQYLDGSEFGFYVPWDYKNNNYNSWQHTKINENGDLVIDIRKRRNNG